MTKRIRPTPIQHITQNVLLPILDMTYQLLPKYDATNELQRRVLHHAVAQMLMTMVACRKLQDGQAHFNETLWASNQPERVGKVLRLLLKPDPVHDFIFEVSLNKSKALCVSQFMGDQFVTIDLTDAYKEQADRDRHWDSNGDMW